MNDQSSKDKAEKIPEVVSLPHSVSTIESDVERRIDELQDSSWPQMLVWDLYTRVLLDEELGHYFRHVNVARVVNFQVLMFKALASGKVPPFTKEQLGKAHSHLKIPDKHFTRLLKHVSDAYAAYNIPEDTISAMLVVLEGYRSAIVTG